MQKIKQAFTNILHTATNEVRLAVKDSGVILFLFGAMLIYSTVYSLVYRNEIFREIPIAVVNESKGEEASRFIRELRSAANVDVAYITSSISEAKDLLYNNNIYGVVYLPHDFDSKLMSSEQTKVGIYADASYFLAYKQIYNALVEILTEFNIGRLEHELYSLGINDVVSKGLTSPAELKSIKLYNPIEGYATYVLPPIMLLIIQQTLLLGIGMVGGTQHERKGFLAYRHNDKPYNALEVTLGKFIAYMAMIVPFATLIFGVVYPLWGYPIAASWGDLSLLMLPYIASVIMLSLTFSALFTSREASIIAFVAWSIPFLMISGVSFPKEGMPQWLYELGYLLPSSNAINGFSAIEIRGAEFAAIKSEITRLWALFAVYGLTAIVAVWRRLRAANR